MEGIKEKLPMVIAVVVAIIILLIVLINNSKEQEDKANENNNSINTSSINSNNQTNTSEEIDKEYYDFIDEAYGTFNVSEYSLLYTMLGGDYTYKGYKRSTSQNDFTTELFSKAVVDYSTSTAGVESISVTISPSNAKVKEFNISFFSNNALTNEQMIELSRGYLILGVAGLKGINIYEMNDTEKAELEQAGKDISEDKFKGLDYSCIRNSQKVQCIFKAEL